MKRAIEIELKILEEDLFLAEAEDISGGERFHLGIGVDISVYDNGTVLVQGKFKPKYRAWGYRTLKQKHPNATRISCRFCRQKDVPLAV